MSGIFSLFLGAGTLLNWTLFTNLLEEHTASIFRSEVIRWWRGWILWSLKTARGGGGKE